MCGTAIDLRVAQHGLLGLSLSEILIPAILFAELYFRSQFNKKEFFVNPIRKSDETCFDTTHFLAKIRMIN